MKNINTYINIFLILTIVSLFLYYNYKINKIQLNNLNNYKIILKKLLIQKDSLSTLIKLNNIDIQKLLYKTDNIRKQLNIKPIFSDSLSSEFIKNYIKIYTLRHSYYEN